MRSDLSRVAVWAIEHPWAITPDMLRLVGSGTGAADRGAR